jgi:hypothetical protein
MPRPLSHNGLVVLKIAHSDPKETYQGLLQLAVDRGYNTGWAAHQFRRIFGCWPYFGTVPPRLPSSDLIEWFGIMRNRYKAKKRRDDGRSWDNSGQVLGDLHSDVRLPNSHE